MKKRIKKSESSLDFQNSIDNMPVDSKIFVDKSLEIANYIQLLMHHRQMRQKDLAILMEKSEAELSKWLGGMHNFTLRSLAKIEAALGTDVICIPEKVSIVSPAITESLSWQAIGKIKNDDKKHQINYSKPNGLETGEQEKDTQTNMAA